MYTEMGMNNPTKAVTAGIAAGAYTGLVLYHPLTSGVKRLRPKHALVTVSVAPLSAAVLAIAGGFQAVGAPTLGTALADIRGVGDKSATVGQLYDGMTIPTAGGADQQTQYIIPIGFVGTALPGLALSIDQILEQIPPILPGGWIIIASTVALTISGGLVWEVEG